MCAFWTLLHVTLAAVSARGLSGAALASDSEEKHIVSTDEAINFVRDFVTVFLSCTTCRQHFLNDFDACAFGRCTVGSHDWRALSLWLWRVHNAVSLRVASRHSSHVDRRWPMYQDCTVCWRESVAIGPGAPSRSLQGTKWDVADLDAVFHTDHVFWFSVRTFIGLEVVNGDLSEVDEGIYLQPRPSSADSPSDSSSAPTLFVVLLACCVSASFAFLYLRPGRFAVASEAVSARTQVVSARTPQIGTPDRGVEERDRNMESQCEDADDGAE